MTENELRTIYVNRIKSWLGATEGGSIHQNILNAYNDIKPLPRGYKANIRDPWCAITVSAAAHLCGLDAIFPFECSCSKMIDIAKRMGIWVEDDNYFPEIGDLVLYDWDDNGKGDCIGDPEHIGAVTFTQEVKAFEVTEGNYKDAVRSRLLVRNNRYIRGFITPEYKKLATPVNPADVKYDVVAREVIAGKWGNGVERRQRLTQAGYDYVKVQKLVNELLKR